MALYRFSWVPMLLSKILCSLHVSVLWLSTNSIALVLLSVPNFGTRVCAAADLGGLAGQGVEGAEEGLEQVGRRLIIPLAVRVGPREGDIFQQLRDPEEFGHAKRAPHVETHKGRSHIEGGAEREIAVLQNPGDSRLRFPLHPLDFRAGGEGAEGETGLPSGRGSRAAGQQIDDFIIFQYMERFFIHKMDYII